MSDDETGQVGEGEAATASSPTACPDCVSKDLDTGVTCYDPTAPVSCEPAQSAALALDELISVDEVVRRHVYRVLDIVKGNKSKAARVLGFDRRTLYRKLAKYEKEVAKNKESV